MSNARNPHGRPRCSHSRRPAAAAFLNERGGSHAGPGPKTLSRWRAKDHNPPFDATDMRRRSMRHIGPKKPRFVRAHRASLDRPTGAWSEAVLRAAAKPIRGAQSVETVAIV